MKDKSSGNGDIPIRGPKPGSPLWRILARGQAQIDKARADERRRERFEKRWGSGKPKGPEPEGGKGKRR